MDSIGVRDLRQQASRWLARVAAGETFTITDRGRPVASLGPPVRSGWQALLDTGDVVPATGDIRSLEVVGDDAEGPTVSALLAVDRDDPR